MYGTPMLVIFILLDTLEYNTRSHLNLLYSCAVLLGKKVSSADVSVNLINGTKSSRLGIRYGSEL
jgi:hypothetical protein